MKYTHNHRFLLPTNRANVRELSGLSAYESRFNNGESATIKPVEFDGIKKQAGLYSFILTAKRWIESTGAVGLMSKPGRYGGTYAHKDIAFELQEGSVMPPLYPHTAAE